MRKWFFYRIQKLDGLVMAESIAEAIIRLQNFFGEATTRNIFVEDINEEEWGGRVNLNRAGQPFGLI